MTRGNCGTVSEFLIYFNIIAFNLFVSFHRVRLKKECITRYTKYLQNT